MNATNSKAAQLAMLWLWGSCRQSSGFPFCLALGCLQQDLYHFVWEQIISSIQVAAHDISQSSWLSLCDTFQSLLILFDALAAP